METMATRLEDKRRVLDSHEEKEKQAKIHHRSPLLNLVPPYLTTLGKEAEEKQGKKETKRGMARKEIRERMHTSLT